MKGRWVVIAAGAAVVAAGAALMRREGDRPLTLDDARYLRLTTRREDGSEVSRPVWFVRRDGAIEIITSASSHKVAQIANDPRVEIAPSDMAGKVDEDAERLTGVARIVRDDGADDISAAVKERYGWQAQVAEAVQGARRRVRNESSALSAGVRIVLTERL